MRQKARADNLMVCYCKKQMGASFSCVCPVIDDEFRHNIVKVVCGCTAEFHTVGGYFNYVMMKFMIHNRTDARITDVNLLTLQADIACWQLHWVWEQNWCDGLHCTDVFKLFAIVLQIATFCRTRDWFKCSLKTNKGNVLYLQLKMLYWAV